MWETKKSLQRELDNAEERVVFHYKRANKAEKIVETIAKIIEQEESNKTPTVYIVEKIKRVIFTNANLNK